MQTSSKLLFFILRVRLFGPRRLVFLAIIEERVLGVKVVGSPSLVDLLRCNDNSSQRDRDELITISYRRFHPLLAFSGS